MKHQLIRLTEQDLHHIIQEAVTEMLSEDNTFQKHYTNQSVHPYIRHRGMPMATRKNQTAMTTGKKTTYGDKDIQKGIAYDRNKYAMQQKRKGNMSADDAINHKEGAGRHVHRGTYNEAKELGQDEKFTPYTEKEAEMNRKAIFYGNPSNRNEAYVKAKAEAAKNMKKK